MSAQSLVRKGCRRVVGDGTSIRVWEDDWLPGVNSHIVSSKPPSRAVTFVSDLLDPIHHTWRHDLLPNLFSDAEIAAILSIPISQTNILDSWA